MYLRKATGFDEIISFGINPLVALMEHFEDEFLDIDNDSDGKKLLYWNLIKGLVLSIQYVSLTIQTKQALKKIRKK